jgi:hypothetical protein
VTYNSNSGATVSTWGRRRDHLQRTGGPWLDLGDGASFQLRRAIWRPDRWEFLVSPPWLAAWVSESTASALLKDSLTFNVAGANSSTVTDIGITFTVDGNVSYGLESDHREWRLGIGQHCLGSKRNCRLMSSRPDATAQAALQPGQVAHVRKELERVAASPGFSNSQRKTRLLRYLVEAALAGRGAEVNEYAIGLGRIRTAYFLRSGN